jgi:arylsulfatase A-like enzyme
MVDAVTPRRPDLILFMTDQQRFDQLGVTSGGRFETPALDALATAGVIFENAYSAATVCVPARSALLTGLQPHRLPTQERFALREGFWTVARELAHAGYETALFGKMHFAPVHSDHGFDTMRLCEHLHVQALGPISEARDDKVDDYHDWLVEHEGRDWRDEPNGVAPPGAHPTEWLEREVSEFLAARDASRPLFLVVSFPHPHAPYDPPEPYASMYDPADSVLPEDGYEVNEALPMVFQYATTVSPTQDEAKDPDAVARFLATVRGLIRQIDDAVGRLVTQLDLERGVLFFTSDHGDFAGHRGLMRKNPWVPFDDLARVPFFVSGGPVAGGRRSAQLVQSCDVALTCLDYAGLAPPADVEFDTRSLRPILDGDPGAEDPDRPVFTALSMAWPMIRRGRFKYMRQTEHGMPVLFDLEADPHESVNLVDDPAHAQTALELTAILDAELDRPVLDVPAPSARPG